MQYELKSCFYMTGYSKIVLNIKSFPSSLVFQTSQNCQYQTNVPFECDKILVFQYVA